MSDDFETCDGKWMMASPIEDGSGVIHVNRFRLYFYARSIAEIEYLASRLFDDFDKYLSLSFSSPAHVNKYKGKKGSDFLQFVLNDLKGLFMDDWVKVGWHEAKQGFAVETQRYVMPFTLTPAPFREHFLGGRRSWIIARADAGNTRSSPGKAALGAAGQALRGRTEQTNVYTLKYPCYVETAAVERFASWLMRLLGAADPTTIFPIKMQIMFVWVTMLNSFAKYHGLETYEPDNPFLTGRKTQCLAGVFFQMDEHDTSDELLEDACVQEIFESHPYLSSQNYSAIDHSSSGKALKRAVIARMVDVAGLRRSSAGNVSASLGGTSRR